MNGNHKFNCYKVFTVVPSLPFALPVYTGINGNEWERKGNKSFNLIISSYSESQSQSHHRHSQSEACETFCLFCYELKLNYIFPFASQKISRSSSSHFSLIILHWVFLFLFKPYDSLLSRLRRRSGVIQEKQKKNQENWMCRHQNRDLNWNWGHGVVVKI